MLGVGCRKQEAGCGMYDVGRYQGGKQRATLPGGRDRAYKGERLSRRRAAATHAILSRRGAVVGVGVVVRSASSSGSSTMQYSAAEVP